MPGFTNNNLRQNRLQEAALYLIPALFGAWLIAASSRSGSMNPGSVLESWSGWGGYPLEQSQRDEPFRWLAPASGYHVPVRTMIRAQHRLRLIVSAWRPPVAPAPQLSVIIEGATVADGAAPLKPTELRFTYNGTIAPGGLLDIELRVTPFKPADDERTLGLTVYGVSWETDAPWWWTAPHLPSLFVLWTFFILIRHLLWKVRRRTVARVAAVSIACGVVACLAWWRPHMDIALSLMLRRLADGGGLFWVRLGHSVPASAFLGKSLFAATVAGALLVAVLPLIPIRTSERSVVAGEREKREGQPVVAVAPPRKIARGLGRRIGLGTVGLAAMIAAANPVRYAVALTCGAVSTAWFDKQRAIGQLNRAWELRPNPAIARQIAENYFLQSESAIRDHGDWQQGAAAARQALRWNPDHLLARATLARAELSLGNYVAAAVEIEWFEQRAGQNFWTAALKAEAAARQCDWLTADREYRRAAARVQRYDLISAGYLEQLRTLMDGHIQADSGDSR